MEFNAVRINSAPDVLVEEIISQVRSGKLKPGEVLPSQRELAKMFNVGLGSVREAIKILDVMGHVNVVRGKGTYISEQPPRDPEQEARLEKALKAMSVAELVKAREIVECGAAKLAAENAHKGNIKKLEQLGRDMDESFNDTEVFYRVDFQFHIAVAEASNNKAIIEMVKLLVDRSHRHINFMSDSLNIALPFTVERAVTTAREVIARIKAGDAPGAEACMNRHINIVYDEIDKEFLSTK
ncbi:MAG: FadR family transcriptional regulator [Desulfobacter sp.]|nr:MAG: FadR family transcriptional regulator [Desulfobacter sp.]